MELALVILVGGLAIQVFVAGMVIAFFRLAGIRPTQLEKRRWAFNFSWTTLLIVVAAASVAAGLNFMAAVAVSALLVGLPVFLASHLLRGRHWLFTVTADEAAMLKGRAELIYLATRRPAFWLLLGIPVLAVPVVSIAVVLVLLIALER